MKPTRSVVSMALAALCAHACAVPSDPRARARSAEEPSELHFELSARDARGRAAPLEDIARRPEFVLSSARPLLPVELVLFAGEPDADLVDDLAALPLRAASERRLVPSYTVQVGSELRLAARITLGKDAAYTLALPGTARAAGGAALGSGGPAFIAQLRTAGDANAGAAWVGSLPAPGQRGVPVNLDSVYVALDGALEAGSSLEEAAWLEAPDGRAFPAEIERVECEGLETSAGAVTCAQLVLSGELASAARYVVRSGRGLRDARGAPVQPLTAAFETASGADRRPPEFEPVGCLSDEREAAFGCLAAGDTWVELTLRSDESVRVAVRTNTPSAASTNQPARPTGELPDCETGRAFDSDIQHPDAAPLQHPSVAPQPDAATAQHRSNLPQTDGGSPRRPSDPAPTDAAAAQTSDVQRPDGGALQHPFDAMPTDAATAHHPSDAQRTDASPPQHPFDAAPTDAGARLDRPSDGGLPCANSERREGRDSLGLISSAQLAPAGDASLRLLGLEPESPFSLTLTATDLAGNFTEVHVTGATVARLATLSITEVLADPEGADANQEYVEIWNFGRDPVELRGILLADAAAKPSIVASDVELAPNTRALLVSDGFESRLQPSAADLMPSAGASAGLDRPRAAGSGSALDPGGFVPAGVRVIRAGSALTKGGIANAAEALYLRDAAGHRLSAAPARAIAAGLCLQRVGSDPRGGALEDFAEARCSPGY